MISNRSRAFGLKPAEMEISTELHDEAGFGKLPALEPKSLPYGMPAHSRSQYNFSILPDSYVMLTLYCMALCSHEVLPNIAMADVVRGPEVFHHCKGSSVEM